MEWQAGLCSSQVLINFTYTFKVAQETINSCSSGSY